MWCLEIYLAKVWVKLAQQRRNGISYDFHEFLSNLHEIPFWRLWANYTQILVRLSPNTIFNGRKITFGNLWTKKPISNFPPQNTLVHKYRFLWQKTLCSTHPMGTTVCSRPYFSKLAVRMSKSFQNWTKHILSLHLSQKKKGVKIDPTLHIFGSCMCTPHHSYRRRKSLELIWKFEKKSGRTGPYGYFFTFSDQFNHFQTAQTPEDSSPMVKNVKLDGTRW